MSRAVGQGDSGGLLSQEGRSAQVLKGPPGRDPCEVGTMMISCQQTPYSERDAQVGSPDPLQRLRACRGRRRGSSARPRLQGTPLPLVPLDSAEARWGGDQVGLQTVSWHPLLSQAAHPREDKGLTSDKGLDGPLVTVNPCVGDEKQGRKAPMGQSPARRRRNRVPSAPPPSFAPPQARARLRPAMADECRS